MGFFVFGWMGGTLGQPTDTVSSVLQKSVLKTPICFQERAKLDPIQNSKLKIKKRNKNYKKYI